MSRLLLLVLTVGLASSASAKRVDGCPNAWRWNASGVDLSESAHLKRVAALADLNGNEFRKPLPAEFLLRYALLNWEECQWHQKKGDVVRAREYRREALRFLEQLLAQNTKYERVDEALHILGHSYLAEGKAAAGAALLVKLTELPQSSHKAAALLAVAEIALQRGEAARAKLLFQRAGLAASTDPKLKEIAACRERKAEDTPKRR